MTDFSKHVVMTRYVSLALRLRPVFFAAVTKNYTVDISTKVVLYFCAVQYHTILYRCFSMGPGIFKATILAVELQCPLIGVILRVSVLRIRHIYVTSCNVVLRCIYNTVL